MGIEPPQQEVEIFTANVGNDETLSRSWTVKHAPSLPQKRHMDGNELQTPRYCLAVQQQTPSKPGFKHASKIGITFNCDALVLDGRQRGCSQSAPVEKGS